MSLITAAYLGRVDEVSKLLDSESDQLDVNEPDAYGDTALHAAAYAGKILTVEDLVRRKANVNARNNVGSTPLHKAVLSNSLPIINCLLENGADANIKNAAQKRPEFYTTNIALITQLKGKDVSTKTLAVPRDRHGQLIGKGGKNLNTIRNASGAEITVPKPDEDSDNVTLGGRPDEIKEAERLILEFLEKEAAPNTRTAGGTRPAIPSTWRETKLGVDKENLRYVIGPKGATIKYIQKQTGSRITIPREDDDETQVSVAAPDHQALEEAVTMIYNAVKTRTDRERDYNSRGGAPSRNRDDRDNRYNGDNRDNYRGNRNNNRDDRDDNNRGDNNRGNNRGGNNRGNNN